MLGNLFGPFQASSSKYCCRRRSLHPRGSAQTSAQAPPLARDEEGLEARGRGPAPHLECHAGRSQHHVDEALHRLAGHIVKCLPGSCKPRIWCPNPLDARPSHQQPSYFPLCLCATVSSSTANKRNMGLASIVVLGTLSTGKQQPKFYIRETP